MRRKPCKSISRAAHVAKHVYENAGTLYVRLYPDDGFRLAAKNRAEWQSVVANRTSRGRDVESLSRVLIFPSAKDMKGDDLLRPHQVERVASDPRASVAGLRSTTS